MTSRVADVPFACSAGDELTPLASIAAGRFMMGAEGFYPEEQPVHEVVLSAFQLEIHPVTNAQFAHFVKATGYKTVAERPLSKEQFPDLKAKQRKPGTMVFYATSGPVDLVNMGQWWGWTPGASWKHPEGKGTTWRKKPGHPVVHIAYEDARAYADWAGRDLPTEAEWEYAARGGLEGAAYCWGDEEEPDGKRMAKYFLGYFPYANIAEKGLERTAPVGSFPANGYGLYDMTGNTWEWTQDWYSAQHDSAATSTAAGSVSEGEDKPCCVPNNPRGGDIEGSYDPNQPQFRIPRRVIKGGSFLCADEYCQRYRPAARRGQMIDTGMSHIGFRCAVRG